MKARCPRNTSHQQFIAIANVTQKWVVDEDGKFQKEIKILEVVHGPDTHNVWNCAICDTKAIVSV
ncbi:MULTISPECIES: hypothetical protein [unclassified Psychrobacillus]|uniref:hypothetical protein n=1 Tax=unclassified Psychrobacillus TaxID=2636677 RepID=UPI0030F95B0A